MEKIEELEKLKGLKKYLEKERRECFEDQEEGTLTAKGEGMVLMIDSIYQYMGWEPVKLVKRKLCKLTEEEKKFWEETYKKNYSSDEFNEEEAYNLTTEATKREFPRLKDCDKLI